MKLTIFSSIRVSKEMDEFRASNWITQTRVFFFSLLDIAFESEKNFFPFFEKLFSSNIMDFVENGHANR